MSTLKRNLHIKNNATYLTTDSQMNVVGTIVCQLRIDLIPLK